MALFLLFRTRPEDRNARGIHSVLVNAADEAAARAAANASASVPHGAPASWSALDLSDTSSGDVIWLEGDAVSLLGMTRGGDPIA